MQRDGAIALIEPGVVDVSSLVTHRFAIDEFEPAFQTAVRRDGLKVIIGPSAQPERLDCEALRSC